MSTTKSDACMRQFLVGLQSTVDQLSHRGAYSQTGGPYIPSDVAAAQPTHDWYRVSAPIHTFLRDMDLEHADVVLLPKPVQRCIDILKYDPVPPRFCARNPLDVARRMLAAAAKETTTTTKEKEKNHIFNMSQRAEVEINFLSQLQRHMVTRKGALDDLAQRYQCVLTFEGELMPTRRSGLKGRPLCIVIRGERARECKKALEAQIETNRQQCMSLPFNS